MVEIVDFNHSQMSELKKNYLINNSYESTTHLYSMDGTKKVIKIFKSQIDIENKVKKIHLIKDRTKNLDFIVTAEFLIKYNNRIIGYGMPYIYGLEFDYSKGSKLSKNILYLKQLSNYLKALHNLNIVYADFPHNFLIKSNNDIVLIDHDNVAIDDLDVDSKNIFLKNYIEKTKTFDKRFDNYLLNLFTIAVINNTELTYLFHTNYKNLEFRTLSHRRYIFCK